MSNEIILPFVVPNTYEYRRALEQGDVETMAEEIAKASAAAHMELIEENKVLSAEIVYE